MFIAHFISDEFTVGQAAQFIFLSLFETSSAAAYLSAFWTTQTCDIPYRRTATADPANLVEVTRGLKLQQVDHKCDVVRFLLDKQRGLSDQARAEAKRDAGKVTAVLPQLIHDKKHGW